MYVQISILLLSLLPAAPLGAAVRLFTLSPVGTIVAGEHGCAHLWLCSVWLSLNMFSTLLCSVPLWSDLVFSDG